MFNRRFHSSLGSVLSPSRAAVRQSAVLRQAGWMRAAQAGRPRTAMDQGQASSSLVGAAIRGDGCEQCRCCDTHLLPGAAPIYERNRSKISGPCPTYRLCCQEPKHSATHSLKRRVVVAQELQEGTKSISVNAKGALMQLERWGCLRVKPEGAEAARRRTRGRELLSQPWAPRASSQSAAPGGVPQKKTAMAAVDEGIESYQNTQPVPRAEHSSSGP